MDNNDFTRGHILRVYDEIEWDDTALVHSSSRATAQRILCDARRSRRGENKYFTIRPATDYEPGYWLIHHCSRDDKEAKQMQAALDRELRGVSAEYKHTAAKPVRVTDVDADRFAQRGGSALLYQLMKPGDVVWCPGIDAAVMTSRLQSHRQSQAGEYKHFFVEPAIQHSSSGTGSACYVQCCADKAEARTVRTTWERDAEKWNRQAALRGRGRIAATGRG